MNTLPHSVLLCLAAACVPAAAQGLPPATVAAAVALAREAALPLAPAGARVEVAPGTLDARLRLAPCQQIETYLPAGARPWGRTRVGLRCRDGQASWNVFLPVTVQVFAPAVVGAQALAAGTTLEDTHLKTALIDWAAETSPVHTAPAALRGRTLARPLAAGQPVRSADLRVRQWFAAGDTVRIVALGKGFSVTGEGQALSPGLEGQPARVKTESGRIVSGMPSGERRIEVAL